MKQSIFVSFFLAFAALSCSSQEARPRAEARANESPSSVLDVEFAPAKSVRMAREIVTTGSLLPAETVTVSTEVAGRVEKVYHDIGDFVARNGMLVELDKRELRLEVERACASLEEALARIGANDPSYLPRTEEVTEVRQAKALLDDAERRLQRAQELLQKGVISQAQLDEARTHRDVAVTRHQEAMEKVQNHLASIKSSQSAVALAEKKLADAEIRSPLAAYVDKRLVSQGEYVRENHAVFVVVQSHTLKLSAEVPEREAAMVRPGVELLLTVDAFPGREFKARVRRISPTVDQKSRTFQIEAHVPNLGNLLKPGFFVRCRILAGERESLVVPDRALYVLAGVKKVFVKAGDRVQERMVQTGTEQNNWIEVHSGVKPGEELAVTRLADLSDGQRVK